MNRKIVASYCICILLSALTFFNLNVEMHVQGFGDYPVHNVDTGLNYASIQEAINADETLDGHTIRVDAGTYYENIVINKSLTLIGEDRETTIIDGRRKGDVVYVTANNTVLCGFTLQNSKLSFGFCGVYLHDSFNSSMFDNNVVDNYFGVFLYDCYGCSVSHNRFNNSCYSVIATGSSCSIFGNNITYTAMHAIWLLHFNGCSIYDNNLAYNWYGIHLSNNCSGCSVFGNNIIANAYGILLGKSSRNMIYRNNIINSMHSGVDLWDSSNNTFCHNNFVNNAVQVYDWNYYSADYPPSINMWDGGYPSGGNYWSDYNGTDLLRGPFQNVTGSDGIGDTSYVIDENNRDSYPLMKPYPWRLPNIGITSVNTSKTIVGQGFNLHINITAFNYGDYTETFNITAYANRTLIQTKTITLTSRNSTTITLTWNTAGAEKGYYSITAYAEPIQDEMYTKDNTLTDGIVLVTIPGDVNGDGIVNMLDIHTELVQRFLTDTTDPRYSPNSDINSDNIINMLDIYIAIKHFMEVDP